MLTDKGQDAVVEAEAAEGNTSWTGAVRGRSKRERLKANSGMQDKHLSTRGGGRAQHQGDVPVAFTESAMEFHSKGRGEDDDSMTSIATMQSKAQISTSMRRADGQPAPTRLRETAACNAAPGDTADTFEDGRDEVVYGNPLADDLAGTFEEEDHDEVVYRYGNPLADDSDSDGGDESASEVSDDDQVNATLHLDSSHHGEQFDEFMQEHY